MQGAGTPKLTQHCRQPEGIRNLMWRNKLTVNTGQGADKTVRDHAAEASLSAGEPSNMTEYKAHLHTD